GFAVEGERIQMRPQTPSDARFPGAQLLDFGLAGGADVPSAAPTTCALAETGRFWRLYQLRGVPKLDGPVHAGGRELLAAMRERDEVDPAVVPGQLGDLLPGRHVPNTHDVVETSRRQQLAVRRKRAEPDPAGMALERLKLLARAYLPELHVVARAG